MLQTSGRKSDLCLSALIWAGQICGVKTGKVDDAVIKRQADVSLGNCASCSEKDQEFVH